MRVFAKPGRALGGAKALRQALEEHGEARAAAAGPGVTAESR